MRRQFAVFPFDGNFIVPLDIGSFKIKFRFAVNGGVVHNSLIGIQFKIRVLNTAESFLYYLTAALFLPGAPDYMKIATSIFLALLIMFSLIMVLKNIFSTVKL